jgi:hypothetical protein
VKELRRLIRAASIWAPEAHRGAIVWPRRDNGWDAEANGRDYEQGCREPSVYVCPSPLLSRTGKTLRLFDRRSQRRDAQLTTRLRLNQE